MSTEQRREPNSTVSETLGRHLNVEMHGIGLLMVAIMAILVVPLLPFLAVGWLLWRTYVLVRRAVAGDEPVRPGDDVREQQARRRAQGR
jgi:energy-converting hydrogenase Eha subunit E